MTGYDDRGDVNRDGLLRTVRAEARRDERTRIRDMLSAAAVAAEEQAGRRKADSRGRWATSEARRAAGMREALAEFDRQFGLIELTAGEPYLSLSNAVDSVELFQFDEADGGEEEELPVRLAVHDGADDSTACAYLSLEEAEEVFRGGLALIELIRQRRADPARTIRKIREAGLDHA